MSPGKPLSGAISPHEYGEFFRQYLSELTQAFQAFVVRGQYIGGPLVEEFEELMGRTTGALKAIGCSSGTSALQLSLIAAGVQPGDEVITVANTYYATARAIGDAGAKPVFCDIGEDGLIDTQQIERLITRRTRAILPVHLYGYSADMPAIRTIASEHRLRVIEDCSHAFGSEVNGKFIGCDSEFACFSLYPTKNLGAFGDAGVILTNSEEAAGTLRSLRYFANAKRDSFDPEALHAQMDPLQATLLNVMIQHTPELIRARKLLANLYATRLSDHFRMLPSQPGHDVVHYVFPIFTPRRNELLRALKQEGISLQVHYPTDLHKLPEFGMNRLSLPLTETHNSEVLTLPVHPSIGTTTAEALCEVLKDRAGR